MATDGKENDRTFREMDSFIYTLVHELKTPIHEISLYAEFIEEDNEGNLKEQSKEDIHSIQRICTGMSDMIQRMMEYSKAGFQRIEEKTIDMDTLVHQIADELKKSCPNRQIRLETSNLPEITADMFLTKLMVTNILSNSIKFTREREVAKIRVGCKRKNGVLEFTFHDNGVGFDMIYADHIFEEFQRLQNDGSYDGSGIGLATVRRIANRYGGEVSIAGWPGRGCEVTVRLPGSMEAEPDGDREERNTIKVGVIGDFSGIASGEERGKMFAYQLAVDEINAGGGINGKKIELLLRDDKSISELTDREAEYLTEKEHVDVLMGSTLSPSRDIMRRYAYRTKTLYFDTQQTEGGVSSHYTFCLSAMPEQQMTGMIQYLIERYGKKCYIVAADYNYGILSAEWAKHLIHQFGGEVVGVEYLDETITDFNPIIDRILQLQTDILFSLCVFPNHDYFYIQWHKRGLNYIPNATTQVVAEFSQNVELDPPILENVYVMASFLEELKQPEAQKFVEKYRSRYGNDQVPYMNMDTETAYTAMYLYKYAVEMAGTTETEAVIAALESGEVFFDGPGGRVTVRGEDHHTIRSLSCFRINENHQAEELFRTRPVWSDYVETMIERNLGVKGGLRAIGINAGDVQYNMLLDKIH